MGPVGGAGGGRVIATGTPEQVADVAESQTGKYLQRYLDKPAKNSKINAKKE